MQLRSLTRFTRVVAILCGGTALGSAQTVTFNSLLQEMSDRDAVAKFPVPAYRQLQGSTYNRSSVARDQADQTFSGWFGDSDGIFYIRTENTNASGQTEYVIMEHQGPGAITKLWTPFFYQDFNNRRGAKIRVYLNGSSVPVIDEYLIELVTRLEWSTAEYGSKPSPANSFTVPHPVSAFTARAGNCYLPIPYSTSCKVTMSGSPFYDIVSYRAYAPGTVVETYTSTLHNAPSNQAQLALTAQRIGTPTNFSGGTLFQTNGTLSPGTAMALNLNPGTAAVRHFEVHLSPAQIATNLPALRSAILIMSFDGEQTVWCPLGEFFSCADSLHPFETFTRSVTSNGVMACRWVMPYQAQATLTLTNLGTNTIDATLLARTGAWVWDANSMLFHANWRPDAIVPGNPPSDWNFIDIAGKGVFVGDSWTVGNIQGSWWGEGDEKIYVDGEYATNRFPSHFGTGTEDYYGWAGGVVPTRTDEFSVPFLSNVRVGGLDGGTRGYNINTRIRSLDAIPFTHRLVFDMESSFGTDMRNPWNVLGYSAAVFWYARPGALDNRPPQPTAATKPILSMAQLQAVSDQIRYGTNANAGSSPAARWNLGEQDPGALPGSPGAGVTKDAMGGNDLDRFGAPTYTGSVPAGGSTLAMLFSGTNSCYHRLGTNMAAYYQGIDLNRFSLGCDAFPTGSGADGFSVAVGMGYPGGGGIFIYHAGGTWRVHVNGVGDIITGPAVLLNTWTRLELARSDFGSGPEYRLRVNGANAGSSGVPAVQPGAAFTLGGHYRNRPLSDSRPFEGCFKGAIDNAFLQNLAPVVVSGPTLVPNFGSVPAGGTFSLSVIASGQEPLQYLWRRNGQLVAATSSPGIAFTNAAPAQSGSFDVVITNAFGSATSAPVSVTVVGSSSPSGAVRAWYRLGDADPGAAPDILANSVTLDEVQGAHLARAGAPTYSADAGPDGGGLAMRFTPAAGDWFTASDLEVFGFLNFSNFSLSFDAKPTAAGSFNIPVCLGRYGGGASFIYMAGGTWRYHVGGIGDQISGGSATLDEWQRVEFRRIDGVNSLWVNGTQVGATGNTLFPIPTPDLSIGAARTGAGAPDGLFAGLIDNVKLTDLGTGGAIQCPTLSLHLQDGQVAVEVAGSPGFLHTLWRSIMVSPASWFPITNRVTNSAGRAVLVDVAPPAAAALYRVSVL